MKRKSLMNLRLFRVSSLTVLTGSSLLTASFSPASVFDVSTDNTSANWNAATRWTLTSGTGTTPSLTGGDSVNIVNTSTLASEVALNLGSVTLASLSYGTADGGTDVTRTIVFRGSGTVARNMTVAGDITKLDSGTLTFRSNTGAGGTLALAVGGDVSLSSGVLNFGSGNGVESLAGLSVTGQTAIVGGTMNLRTSVDASLGRLSMTGGTLNLVQQAVPNGNRTITVSSLEGTGGTIGQNSTGTGAVMTLAVSGSLGKAFSGTISNGAGTSSVAFSLAGTGVQSLAANNTYAAGTTVSGGLLLADSSTGSSLGTGAVSILSGGSLGGQGLVALGSGNSITVASGGVLAPGGSESLAPGSSVGTLLLSGGSTTGAILKMNAGATFSFDLAVGNASDSVAFWNYAGSTDFVLSDNTINFSGAQEGTFTLFSFYSDNGTTLTSSGITTGLVLGSGLAGYDAVLNYGTNSITLTLTAVPEPSAGVMLLSSIGLLALFRKRRTC